MTEKENAEIQQWLIDNVVDQIVDGKVLRMKTENGENWFWIEEVPNKEKSSGN